MLEPRLLQSAGHHPLTLAVPAAAETGPGTQTEAHSEAQEAQNDARWREFKAGEGMRERRPPAHPPIGVLPAVQSLLYVLVVALFLMTFTVQPIRIPSSSMEPTLLVGDFLMLDKQSAGDDVRGLMPPSGIARGDVIVFHDPVDDPGVQLVKRVVGLPGDRLHLRNGVVYLNGKPLEEQYAVHRRAATDVYRDDFPVMQTMDSRVNPNWWIRLRGLVHDGDVFVPQGSYFVLGDNRNDSEDSRYWGFVPRAAIVGKPVIIYFSWLDPGSDDPGALKPVRAGAVSSRTNFARWDRTFRVVH